LSLAAAGLLDDAEAQLIRNEANRLQEQIYRNPPTDSRVLCYDMVDVLAARQSLTRIAARLPLLQHLAAGGVVHRAAMEKVMSSIEADLKELANKSELAQLSAQEKTQAQQQRAAAEKALARIKLLLASPVGDK
jgi:multidrug resistance efflux pump